MKILDALSAIVVCLCFVAPLMASPIPIGAPSSLGYSMGSNIGLGFSELDMLSSSYKQAPDGFNVQGSTIRAALTSSIWTILSLPPVRWERSAATDIRTPARRGSGASF